MTNLKTSLKLRIVWGSILAGTTILVFSLAILLVSRAADEPTSEVAWAAVDAELHPDLTAHPLEFRYDKENDLLIYRGKMSSEVRKKLLNLNFMKAGEDTRTLEEQKTYKASIIELAYKSNAQKTPLGLLLLITALGGIIGVQARSVSYFILHTCVLDDLDLKRWWPWYCLRPMLGMIFGPLVVLLMMTGVLTKPATPQLDALTMFVLAILVGMVANMFFNKLVQTAQTLFGLTKSDATESSAPSEPTPVTATGAWVFDEEKKQVAHITWDASTDSKLRHYEIRMTPAEKFDDEKCKTLDIVQPGTEEYFTTEGLAEVGEKASFKVYVVLTNETVSGSEAVVIERKELNPEEDNPDGA